MVWKEHYGTNDEESVYYLDRLQVSPHTYRPRTHMASCKPNRKWPQHESDNDVYVLVAGTSILALYSVAGYRDRSGHVLLRGPRANITHVFVPVASTSAALMASPPFLLQSTRLHAMSSCLISLTACLHALHPGTLNTVTGALERRALRSAIPFVL